MDSSDRSEFRITTGEFRILDDSARGRGVAVNREVRPRALERRDDRRRALDRQLHGAVIAATRDGVGEGPFAEWWYDLRRGHLRLYGGLLRFIDLSILRRVPKWVLVMIPDTIRAYIEDQHPDGVTAR